MAALMKLKKEQFCQSLVQHKLNATQAYLSTHPNASYATAEVKSWELTKQPEVIERTKEILRENNLDIDNIIPSLKEELIANKPLLVGKGKYELLPDHNIRLETKKVLLKLNGALRDTNNITDARSIHITMLPDKLEGMLGRLEALNSALDVDVTK